MFLALLLAAGIVDWVPARWHSSDPKSLELLAGTPVNCVLVEQPDWSDAFSVRAGELGIQTLGVIRPGGDTADAARRAVSHHLSGVVLEGDFPPGQTEALQKSNILTVELPLRRHMRLDAKQAVLGTYQGVWPGVQVEEAGAAKAAPSGAPWIDTNAGFLRYVRAFSDAPVWIANLPPKGQVIPVERYIQAVADAAMTGARWVVALDSDFERRLEARDASAMNDWKRLARHLQFYEEHKEWRALQPHGQFTLVEDANSGALLSGGILDMIAVKHTPVRPVPVPRLNDQSMQGSKMAVDVDASTLSAEQKEVLKRFTRAGGTLLTGPPGWSFPSARGDQITLDKDDLAKLDTIWKELNSMTGRRNLGARLFNVSTMLSNLVASPDGKQVVLQLVNYSNFPAEDITIHILGEFRRVRIYKPDGLVKELDPYKIEEGIAVEIQKVETVAVIVLDSATKTQ